MCNQPAEVDRTKCAAHLKWEREYRVAYRAAHPVEDAGISKRRKERLRAAGLCYRCGRALEEGFKKCERCRKAQNILADKRRRRLGRPTKEQLRQKNVEFGMRRELRELGSRVSPEVLRWVEDHREVFYEKGDTAMYQTLPLTSWIRGAIALAEEKQDEVGDLSLTVDAGSSADLDL